MCQLKGADLGSTGRTAGMKPAQDNAAGGWGPREAAAAFTAGIWQYT